MKKKKVVVVLSGGQDSTTCLYWVKRVFSEAEVHAITFNYGQRHSREIEAAVMIGAYAEVASHPIIQLPPLFGSSPLTDHKREVGQYKDAESLPGGLEATFVPGRNLIMLSIAASYAYSIGAQAIVTGVSQEDYGGYPDCRQEFINSLAHTINLAMEREISILTPLIYLTKKETVELAERLGEDCMVALAYTHTCYKGEYPPCGKCHACLLRAKGFKEAGIQDPLTDMEGLSSV